MVHLISKVALVSAVLIAVLYQFLIKSLIFDLFGYGRVLTPLSSFKGLSCEKITELGLEACEDMWLHDDTGYLYMACSSSQSKTQWLPALVF
jgi:arylesterase/paraoxonase